MKELKRKSENFSKFVYGFRHLKNDNKVQELNELTFFLDEHYLQPIINQRLWHVWNNIFEPSLCKYCGSPLKISSSISLKNNTIYLETCAKDSCITEMKKEHYFKKHGVTHQSHNQIVQEKKRQTCQEKYGHDNPMQDELVRKKSEDTKFKKTGYKHNFQDSNSKEKSKQTCRDKFGCDHPMLNAEVIAKREQLYFDDTGYKNPGQNPSVQEKMRQTYKEKTGYSNPAQNPEVKRLKRSNWYGKSKKFQFTRNKNIQEQRSQTYKERTGYERC